MTVRRDPIQPARPLCSPPLRCARLPGPTTAYHHLPGPTERLPAGGWDPGRVERRSVGV